MSKFQATVSTIAALSTIAVTSVTAYKVFDNQQENTQKQQVIIEDLKQQLEAKKPQPITPPSSSGSTTCNSSPSLCFLLTQNFL
mgnify:CR=1 FL=1